MSDRQDMLQTVISEMEGVLAEVDRSQLERAIEALVDADRIFVVGEGRSGLMGKAFAMRLMHLGATVYAVGETITPSIARNDVLVAISGSGLTEAVAMVAVRARALNCAVLVLTTNPEAKLPGLATTVVRIPAATKFRRTGEHGSAQPLGSLFDQCAHVVLDALCLGFAEQRSVTQHEAFARHTNIE